MGDVGAPRLGQPRFESSDSLGLVRNYFPFQYLVNVQSSVHRAIIRRYDTSTTCSLKIDELGSDSQGLDPQIARNWSGELAFVSSLHHRPDMNYVLLDLVQSNTVRLSFVRSVCRKLPSCKHELIFTFTVS